MTKDALKTIDFIMMEAYELKKYQNILWSQLPPKGKQTMNNLITYVVEERHRVRTGYQLDQAVKLADASRLRVQYQKRLTNAARLSNPGSSREYLFKQEDSHHDNKSSLINESVDIIIPEDTIVDKISHQNYDQDGQTSIKTIENNNGQTEQAVDETVKNKKKNTTRKNKSKNNKKRKI